MDENIVLLEQTKYEWGELNSVDIERYIDNLKGLEHTVLTIHFDGGPFRTFHFREEI